MNLVYTTFLNANPKEDGIILLELTPYPNISISKTGKVQLVKERQDSETVTLLFQTLR